MITREAVGFSRIVIYLSEHWHQYDSSFAIDGAKIGFFSLRIRLPSDYTVRQGPANVIGRIPRSSLLRLTLLLSLALTFHLRLLKRYHELGWLLAEARHGSVD